MENYFITRGTEKKGPFSIDDLRKMSLTNDYLVWKEGFEKWKPIIEIEELKSIVIKTPPPTPHREKRKKQKSVFLKSLKLSGIWMPFIWLFIFIIMGGFSYDEYLQQLYGYGEYAIYGGGEEIRKSLIYASFILSFGISLIILLIEYISKNRSITNSKFKIGATVVHIKSEKHMRISHFNEVNGKYGCNTINGKTFEGYFDENEIRLF